MKALYPSRHAWARAFTSKIFTAGVQTTFRVEGLNAIIKRTLTASSSLCNFADVLDARLQNEAQWNRFFEYHTMSSCMGIVSSEMAQCLYFVVSQINLTNDNEDFSSLEVADKFVENLYDAKQILLKSIIAKVGEEKIQEV
ncbi:hypothetical protein Glove_90g4 [Diversispora epigaea]|uniref:Protein FAR1-RELATED SEQUENCE n=1 Tax=Diversispora epigaea TaxID=1348612 RepID=A0A397J5J8_9GLOM|nr:hypothetical protein Glove_90g4 [Diversispora epigaea]